ncbi:hypothetical protein DL98DRAFT_648248 [Cadophora sp. DSE1049]|nr:hypothetical protein DL98DRAFT_648248 [Cadophora sp. DSE1049]
MAVAKDSARAPAIHPTIAPATTAKENPDATECDNEPGSKAAFEDESGDGHKDGSGSDSENDSEIEAGEAAPMKSLVQLAEEALLRVLSKAVDSEQSTARYCCGGSIPAVKPQLAEEQTKVEEKGTAGGKIDTSEKARNQKAWRYGDVQAGRKVTPAKPLGRLHLIKACGSEDLDQSKFTVDFHPQDHGILDAISQILLPSWENKFLSRFPEHQGVRVDNCRLHVSTIEAVSDIQAGSSDRLLGQLMVCLKSSFEGGELTVSSDGHESVFGWNSSALEWIAFTRDCDFEFAEVTKGTQVFLVYDLLVTKRVGYGALSGIDPKLLPLYQGVRDMLADPGFMKTGGTLGYYCRYPYSHTDSRLSKHLPRALRGVDMVVYTVFKWVSIIDARQLERLGYFDDYDIEEWMEERCCCPRIKVGKAFHELRIGHYPSPFDEDYDMGFDESLESHWPMKEVSGVIWLNTPNSGGKKPRELAVVMEEDRADDMCCCPDCRKGHYFERIHSLVGILVSVPKMADRNLDF